MATHIQLGNDVLTEFCCKWRVREVSVVGGALRDDFGPDSDLDFLVSFEPEAQWDAFSLIDMKQPLAPL